MAKTQIKNYVFKPGIGFTDNLFPDAYDLIERNRSFIQKETVAWIQSQIDAGATGFVGYTFNSDEYEVEIGRNIDALLYDLRYSGNSQTYKQASYYWEQDVAQISGSRIPEKESYNFVKTLILDYVLDNEEFSALNIVESQVIDTEKTPVVEADARVAELLDIIVNVIENGLSALPNKEETGVGHITVQGQYDLEDILLVTNVTKNEIIFNFSNPATGGTVDQVKNGASEDFPSYLQITDAVTKISLNYDTTDHSSDDEIQIFVENTENGKSQVVTRPYDFGTDAIERMRVATPLSMLDADFEYGLQPTKWAAIGTLRGYPSVYEIPGTDTPVASIVTDASAGTEGIGQSLITVTTVGPHGFSPGTPVTIKALEDSVSGAARAEGSFVIVEVLSDTSFTYFAKSKVGDTNGQVLATTFTQLRQAGFYTGSSIGNPEITVESQGSAGTLQTELKVLTGSNILPYDGDTPEIGAPLEHAGGAIPTGTQVTGIISQSQGGGTYITPIITDNTNTGGNTIEVQDSTGIVPNLAVDRGDGYAIFVNSVNNNTLEFDSNFTQDIIANVRGYSSIIGINQDSTGSGAAFDISLSNDSTNSYIIDNISNSGVDYRVGDRILISGEDLGGISPDNDLLIIVEEVDESDAITVVSILEGEHFSGVATFSNVSATTTGGVGENAAFDVTYEDGVYISVDIPSPDFSQNYKTGDVIVIPGSVINFVNGNENNNLSINVTSVGAGGAIESIIFDGTAPDHYEEFNNVSYSTSGIGSGAIINVEIFGNSYNVIIPEGDEGQDFNINDTLTVSGTNLSGTSPENDLAITVTSVNLDGGIEDFDLNGTASNAGAVTGVTGTNRIGSGATFDVTLDNGSYSVAIVSPGLDYGLNQELIISGNNLGGNSPANDISITTSEIDELATGTILDFVFSGTGFTAAGSYTNVTGSNDPNIGTGASFNILREFDTYSIIPSTTGQDYKIGDRILISGSQLDGIDDRHDILLRVTNVINGEINSFIADFDSAFPGTELDLIATVSISEFTTGELVRFENITFSQLATLEVTFGTAHGLVPGDTFIIDIDSDDGANNHGLASGSFFATDIPSINKLRFQARAAGAIDTGIDNSDRILGEAYPRPDSFFIHRPYDGGVQLGTGGPQHGSSAVRQSKKYIRYQSGKGIMYTTGALFAPSYDLRSVTSDGVEVGSLITITTDDNDHGVQEGGVIRLLGIETPGYSSGPETAVPPQFDYVVENVIDERTFQVRSQRRLGDTTATLAFGAQMSVISWHGATVRSGIFDDQNGIFWEYDGTQISVVQRTGTFQIAGTMNLQRDRNLITGNNTRFRDQLKAGDKIIIKGMTHVVSHVNSQTEMTVTPDWRGVRDIDAAKGMLIIDKKVKQADFNIDKLDGTGPSGYDIDIAKMQMIGIQYSWYGAGFIDFMVRGADGNFVYAHRMRNSNVNTEAFMRSGNLPVRYEVTNEGPPGKLKESLTDSATELALEDSSFFPEQGTVYIDNEIIEFTGKDDSQNKLTGLIRGTTLDNFQAGAQRFYSAGDAATHDARTGVILISNTITPLISHWGSAFITDGQFDDDRGYIFSYAETGVTVSTTTQTAFLIRLAPSVSNALVGDLGERELLNRAQLLLQGIEITSDRVDSSSNEILGGIVVEGVLNPQNYPINPNDIGWSGLSGVAQGGQPSFAEIASGGSVSWSTGEAATTATVNALATITVQAQMNTFQRNSFRDYAYFYPSFLDENISVGDRVQDTKFPSGTTITQISDAGTYVFVRFSNRSSQRLRDNEFITFAKGRDLVNRNFAFFDKTSFENSGAKVATNVTGGSVSFPANTSITNISLRTFGDTDFYVVEFNNAFDGTLVQDTGTVEFTFIQPPFAQPGETVFSFIANPGERSELDLQFLKELTNTPLGGRGTFPNGPDVLAINVYKVKGAETDANIILKWGEAQA